MAQAWCTCGSLDSLTDANGHETSWERDAEGRVTREVRADGTTATNYTYETATSRLKMVTDPKGQVTTYTYNLDDTVQQVAYPNAAIPTAPVSYTNDASYPRVATMVDGTGTTTFGYHAAGELGAGQVASVDGPLTDDTITYIYDELGRVTSRAINGVAASQTYDALGRTTAETNVLGTFTYGYDGVTRQLASVTYPNGQTSAYSYLDDQGDHRLQTIHHKYPDGATLSQFEYTYDAAGNILTWRQQSATTAVMWTYGYDAADQLTAAVKKSDPDETVLQRYAYAYDPAGNRTSEQIDDGITRATHDALNRLLSQDAGGPLVFQGQLDEPAAVTINGRPATVTTGNTFQGTAPVAAGTTTVTIDALDPSGNAATAVYEVDQAATGKTFTYDANGNLTSDGSRTFEWDARNQLVAVNVGTHRSEFSYDGLQRRVREIEKEDGATQFDSRVVWCVDEICEERAGDGLTVMRRAFGLGEQVAGAAQFVASDHLWSVTDVTDGSAALLARYAYDVWGRRTLTAGVDAARVGFSRHRWQVAGALWLTEYRALDPEPGRWITEDPLGMQGGFNRYAYVLNNPITEWDAFGLDVVTKPPYTGDPKLPGEPPGRVLPWNPRPNPGPRPPSMTPKNVLTNTGKIGMWVIVPTAVIWSWSCVIKEGYCATQGQQGYNACMDAADPNGWCVRCTK